MSTEPAAGSGWEKKGISQAFSRNSTALRVPALPRIAIAVPLIALRSTPKGIDLDSMYRNLLTFQTNISQAAGKITAIQKRHDIIEEYFYHFKNHNEIIGDKKYFEKKKKNPEKIRENISL